jgi:hypothetical protein
MGNKVGGLPCHGGRPHERLEILKRRGGTFPINGENPMSKVATEKPEMMSLDARIADLLRPGADQLSSSALMTLIAEVDKAIKAADQEGRTARAHSIDPSIVDGGARGRAEDAEFLAMRYRAGLTKLNGLHHAALTREEQARWNADAEGVRKEAEELGAHLKETYLTNSAAIVMSAPV